MDALTQAIAAQPLSHWTATFAKLCGPWAPVQDSVQLKVEGVVT